MLAALIVLVLAALVVLVSAALVVLVSDLRIQNLFRGYTKKTRDPTQAEF